MLVKFAKFLGYLFTADIIFLIIGDVNNFLIENHIGAPLSVIGLINESNKIVAALNGIFDRLTVLVRPKKSTHCLIFERCFCTF